MAASTGGKRSNSTAKANDTAEKAPPRKAKATQPRPVRAMAAEAQQPEVKTTSPAPEPAPAPADSDKTDFEKAQERYGSAYAILADGLKGEGVDKTVKIVQYALAAAAVFVIFAAVYSSL